MEKPRFREFLLLTGSTLLSTLGIYFFKFPNHFSTGGVSGVAILLGNYFPHLSSGTLVLVINMVLLAIGFLVFGKGFGFKTAYCSILMSVSIQALELLFPMDKPLTDEPFLELIFAMLLPALGSAFLFNIGASTGGTDIVAMLLKKYTSLHIGKALLLSDILITLGTFLVFDIKTGLFSVMGLTIKSLLVDSVIENINLCKYFTIITSKPEEICQYIVHELNRGATVFDGKGAFSHDAKQIILTVMGRAEAVALRNRVRAIDPHAFVLITNTSEIIGKGFRGQS